MWRSGRSACRWRRRRRDETLKEDLDMTMATTTIRIDINTLPEHLDRSRLNSVAASIEDALKEVGVRADCPAKGRAKVCGRAMVMVVRHRSDLLGQRPFERHRP
jgi:hypothetical protein